MEMFTITCHVFCMCLTGFNTSDPDLRVADDVWLPLVVSAGPSLTDSGSGISKIANSVVIPLADQGVSVYCLSTYRTDYVLVSLFSSSYNAAARRASAGVAPLLMIRVDK